MLVQIKENKYQNIQTTQKRSLKGRIISGRWRVVQVLRVHSDMPCYQVTVGHGETKREKDWSMSNQLCWPFFWLNKSIEHRTARPSRWRGEEEMKKRHWNGSGWRHDTHGYILLNFAFLSFFPRLDQNSKIFAEMFWAPQSVRRSWAYSRQVSTILDGQKEFTTQGKLKKIDLKNLYWFSNSASRLGQFLDATLCIPLLCTWPAGSSQNDLDKCSLDMQVKFLVSPRTSFFYTESIGQTMQVFSLRKDWLKVELPSWYQELRDFYFYAPVSKFSETRSFETVHQQLKGKVTRRRSVNRVSGFTVVISRIAAVETIWTKADGGEKLFSA